MNYNNLNKVYDFWKKKILPYMSHNFTAISFDDYLKRFSYLPSGKWMRDMETIKFVRLGIPIDPKKFVKKYKDSCITYNSPVKPEDGMQRIVYQLSPTLHLEMALWAWVEHDVLQSYASLMVCYHNEEEFSKFADDVYPMRQSGNTEDKPETAGFIGFRTPGETDDEK